MQVRAVEHIREREKALELRERPDPAVYEAGARGNCPTVSDVPPTLVGVPMIQVAPPSQSATAPPAGLPAAPLVPGTTPEAPMTPAAPMTTPTTAGGESQPGSSPMPLPTGSSYTPQMPIKQAVMSRILVYEWCCATLARGKEPRAASLWTEGWAMLSAVLADFCRVPGVEITTILSPTLRDDARRCKRIAPGRLTGG